MNKCETCENLAEIICGCSSIKLCSKCIGVHLINDPSFHHKPQVIPQLKPVSSISEHIEAIKDRLTKEIGMLNDFKEISVQFTKAVVQTIEKQLHAAAEDLQQRISYACTRAHNQLSASLGALNSADPESNGLIKMLIENPSTISEVKIIDKELDFLDMNIKEIVENNVKFSASVVVSTSEEKNSRSPRKQDSSFAIARKFSVPSASRVHNFSEEPRNSNVLQKPLKKMTQVFWFSEEALKMYDPFSDEFSETALPKQEIGIEGSSWAVADNSLLVTGGIVCFPKNSTWIFKIAKNEFIIGPAMKTPRFNHASVSSGKFLYVVGGFNRSKLRDCERYDVLKKRWERIGSLCVAREKPSACVHSSKLYVGGGADSLETYNPTTNKFNIIRLKVPEVLTVILIPQDENILLVGGGVVGMYSPNKMTYVEMAEIPAIDFRMQGQVLATDTFAYFPSDSILYKFDMEELKLSIISNN